MLIPLLSGAYQSRSVIADAQSSINLFAEPNPPNTSPEVPVTNYPTPGLTLLAAAPAPAAGRGLYVDSTNQLFAVVGRKVYKVSQFWVMTEIGTLNSLVSTPVGIIDNETTVFAVDGTPTGGYTWDVGTGNNFAVIADPDFLGSYRVDFLNTYFLFARPLTPTFYTSLSNVVDFDPLYFANMTGQPTNIEVALASHGVVWLLGDIGSEIWFDSGDTNQLPFQRMPDMVLHQGCVAPYSAVRVSGDDDSQTALYWLSRTREGNAVILAGRGYAATRVSTYAIEQEIQGYTIISDAVGYTYQQDGHSFYVLTFPNADVTWVYDTTTGQWHQRTWIDGNGVRHRHRVISAVNAYGKVVAQDWETGALYAYDTDNYTDNGAPIERVRAFPHLVSGLNRVSYARFIADMEAGANLDAAATSLVSLRWSDTRGRTWGNYVQRSFGRTGEYLTQPLWLQLGMARDRVFELSWSTAAATALNGAYVEPIPLAS